MSLGRKSKSNVDRITIIHPTDPEKYHTFRKGQFSYDGNEAKVGVNQVDTPSWHDQGMEIIVSKKPGQVDFSGVVVGMKMKPKTVANPQYCRIYQCEPD